MLRDAVYKQAVVVSVAVQRFLYRHEREPEIHYRASKPDCDDAECDAAVISRVFDSENEVGQSVRLAHDEREKVKRGHRQEQHVRVAEETAENFAVMSMHALERRQTVERLDQV